MNVEPQKHDCEITELPGLGGSAAGMAISSDGAYIAGEAAEVSYNGPAAVWHDGDLETVPGGKQFDRGMINSSGVLVGHLAPGKGASTWYSDAGKRAELRYSGADRVDLLAVNESGDIVGNAVDYGKTYDPESDGETTTAEFLTPVLWKNGSAKPVTLDLQKGMNGAAWLITDDGLILGSQYRPDKYGKPSEDEAQPWLWRADGKGWKLPSLPEDAAPSDISGDWVLSGSGRFGPSFRWRLSDPGKFEKLSSDLEPGASIDSEGRVYGHSLRDRDKIPVRQDGDDDLVELPSIQDPDGDHHGMVNDVDADGSVLAGESLASADSQSTSAVSWTCGG